MKILCDIHISYQLVNFLNGKGVNAIHLNSILNKWNTKDKDVCKYADENDYVVVTKDVDFRNSYFLQRTPKKLIKVNLGNISNSELIKIFESHLTVFKKHFDNGRCYIELNKEYITISKEKK